MSAAGSLLPGMQTGAAASLQRPLPCEERERNILVYQRGFHPGCAGNIYVKGAFTLNAASIPASAYAASRLKPKRRTTMLRTSSIVVSPLRAVIRMP